MPIYEYRCRKCGEKFEMFRRIHDGDSSVECPECGEKHPQRVLSSVFSKCSTGYRGNLTFPT